jgi:hypothetical protein
MAQEETAFNFTLTVLIITICAGLVAIGIRDTNQIYRSVSRGVSQQEMHQLALALQGDYNMTQFVAARRNQVARTRAERDGEISGVFRFLRTLVP